MMVVVVVVWIIIEMIVLTIASGRHYRLGGRSLNMLVAIVRIVSGCGDGGHDQTVGGRRGGHHVRIVSNRDRGYV